MKLDGTSLALDGGWIGGGGGREACGRQACRWLPVRANEASVARDIAIQIGIIQGRRRSVDGSDDTFSARSREP